MRAAGDPDTDTLQDWLVQGAPLGMDRRIETTGVFPPADNPDKEDYSPTPGVAEQVTEGWEHHRSVLENPEDAHKEFERYRAAQIAVDFDKTTLERIFPKGHVNGLEFAPDFTSRAVTVRIPAKTTDASEQDAQELLYAQMLPLEKLRRLAGKGGWIMNLLPKARLGRHRRRGAATQLLGAGKARKHTRGGVRACLVAKRQVEVALRWIVAFWSNPQLLRGA